MKKQNLIKVLSFIFVLAMLVSIIPMALTASAANVSASENLASSATPEAYSSHSVGPVANINDGNYTNRWTKNDGVASKDAWVQLVWDCEVTFNCVTLYEWKDSYTSYRVEEFILYISDDGQDFTPIYTGTTIEEKAIAYLSQPVTTKYLRLVVTNAGTSDWPSIAEIEVTNSQNLAALATPEAHNSHSAGPIANLNDGNYTNRWTHNGDLYTQAESWCQLVWDSEMTFNYIALYEWPNEHKTQAFTLYASDDGEEFREIYSGGAIGTKAEVFLSGTVTAKYLRLVITDAGTSDWASIAEIEVANLPKNIAPDATASAFHSHESARLPMSINDGDYSNRWTMGDPYTFDFSGSDLFWCQLTWDNTVIFDNVVLYEYSDNYTPLRVGDFELQISDDGTEYKTVYTGTGIGGYKIIDLDSPVTAKYLRLVIKSSLQGNNAPNIAEIEVFNYSGHIHTEEVIPGKAATCTESGLTDGKKCSECGEIYAAQEIIDALGHTEVVDAAVAATCTVAGKTEGKHCSVCNEVLVAQDTVAALGHKASEAVKENSVNATCSKNGSYDLVVYCSVCNAEIGRTTETVLATGDHIYATEQKKVAPNCTEAGYVIMACGCGATEKTDIEPLGHKASEAVKENIVDATCTKEGSYDLVVYCSVCNAEIERETKTVSVTGHTEVVDKAVAASCTAEGKTEGKHCSVCKAVLVAQETVAALGHTEVVDAAVAATCTEAGKTEGKHCSVCKAVLVAQETVAALGHTEVEDAAVAATCTENGKSAGSHCSVCNEVLEAQTVITAPGHALGDWVVSTPATESEPGIRYRQCSNCSHKVIEEIPELTHDHSRWDEIILPAKAATCTETGLTEGKKCSGCNSTIVDQEIIPVLPHTEVVDEGKAATCTEKGLTTGKHCSVCNTVLVPQKATDALGHDMVKDSAKAPTCTETGLTEGSHCSRCDHKVAQETVAALGHTEVVDAAVAATCTEAGKTEGKHCSVCNTVLVAQETVAALGHTEVVDAAVAATCTAAGKTEGKHCSVCNEVLVAQTEVKATGHDFADATTEAPKTCKTCGATEGDKLSSAEKDHSECEAGWFANIWNAIINFFRKLFGLPAKCVCGE